MNSSDGCAYQKKCQNTCTLKDPYGILFQYRKGFEHGWGGVGGDVKVHRIASPEDVVTLILVVANVVTFKISYIEHDVTLKMFLR
jgi:hypothetical protein